MKNENECEYNISRLRNGKKIKKIIQNYSLKPRHVHIC